MGLRRKPTDGSPPIGPEPDYTPDPRRPPRVGRSVLQWLVLGFNSLVILALFTASAAVLFSNHVLGSRQLIDIEQGAQQADPPPLTAGTLPINSGAPPVTSPGETLPSTTVPITLAPASVGAKNILMTASDSRDCVDPNSPYAGAFGSADDVGGSRADTIMMLRVDPGNDQAAILSFPRDLWVKIDGRSAKSRINAALDKNNPLKLINTIRNNFLLQIDHWINIDFCAFKDLVDAVGGIAVPFAFAARDKNTGLYIDSPQCHLFGGEEGLAYVRSRHYQWLDPKSGKWKSDPTADLGRIERQQDFVKRAMGKALGNWLKDPTVAKDLIDAAITNVITDSELTPKLMLEIANALRNFDASTVRTFQVEGVGIRVNEASVLRPVTDSKYMRTVLAVFRGGIRIAEVGDIAPEAPTTTSPFIISAPPPVSTIPGQTTVVTTSTIPATTVPTVVLEDQQYGISPPDDPTCK